MAHPGSRLFIYHLLKLGREPAKGKAGGLLLSASLQTPDISASLVGNFGHSPSGASEAMLPKVRDHKVLYFRRRRHLGVWGPLLTHRGPPHLPREAPGVLPEGGASGMGLKRVQASAVGVQVPSLGSRCCAASPSTASVLTRCSGSSGEKAGQPS